MKPLLASFILLCGVATTVLNAEDADLAQELTNPIADLMTIPIQATYDQNLGPVDEGTKLQTNVQPVIPVDISEDWNLITRTILPIIKQDEIYPSSGSQFGLGDTSLSLFLSPKNVCTFTGNSSVNNTFLQPFAAYTWSNAWTVSLQSESTYNWKSEEWAVPFTAAVAKLVRFGKVPVSLQAGAGYWAKSATNGAEGVRFRLQANIVLPKL